MSWFAPGAINPFQGLANGSTGTSPFTSTPDISTAIMDQAAKVHSAQEAYKAKTAWANIENQVNENGVGALLDDTGNNPGTSAKDSDESSSAADYLLSMFRQTGDSAWLEKYIDQMIERENTASARQYETEMSNTSFSRLVKDIENAGYNPWLALQSGIGQASTPSVSAAGRSDISYSSQKNSREKAQKDRETDIASRFIAALGIIGAMLVKTLV